MPDRTTPPKILDAIEFDLKLKPYEHYELDNHVPVYAIHAGAEEVVMIEWVFYAGNWYEEKNIIAATTNYLLKNGTSAKSAYQINEYFEFYGASLSRSCYNETATITLHCLSKYVKELLPVVAELLTECIFPQEELIIYKQNQKQRLEINLKKCDFVAARLIDEYVFGIGHPYGKYTSTLDYDALQRDELVQFYHQFYTQGKCLVFAAGKLPSETRQLLNNHFGRLPLNKKELEIVRHLPSPAQQKTYHILNDPNGVQAAIRIARPFPNRHHPDFPGAQVLNNIFGGYFGSRLMSNIREDKGYTYGIHSYIQNHIHDTAWMISTEAGRDVADATITEIFREMKLLCEEPVGVEELHLVRNHMIGSILADLDGPFQILGRWKNYILNNLTEEFFQKSLHIIKTISGEELQLLAQQYFVPEEFYQLKVI